MLCDHCKENEATFHYHANKNGEETKADLCADCARELGYTTEGQFNGMGQLNFEDYVSSMLKNLLGQREVRGGEVQSCEICGCTVTDIKKSGKVGCAHCYTAFAPVLMPFIRRIHGRGSHTGKIPEGAGRDILRKHEIAKLKEEMNAAVMAQEYERAAVLRDEIALKESGEG